MTAPIARLAWQRPEVTPVVGPNHDLFVKVLAHIERKPEAWQQNFWSRFTDDEDRPLACGTAHCFAGWAIAIAEGVNLTSNRDEEILPWAYRLLGIPGDFERYYDSRPEAPHLFDGSNTLDDLYRLSADILGIDETVLRDKVAAEVAS